MDVLAGRIAIVTGAAQGIGAAIAQRYVEEGARVAMFDADGDRLNATQKAIGGETMAETVDVRDDHQVGVAVEAVLARWSGIDILVNNAATRTHKCRITELSLADWNQALQINLTGAFLLCRAVLPVMQRAHSGVIINIASQLGSVAVPASAAYCTTKGGMLQFTRALALDHAEEGIRVNSLSPGAVLTERITRMYSDEALAEQALAPLHPIGRLGRAHEIAGAAVFLASPDATFMTGADLVVDGGYTAR